MNFAFDPEKDAKLRRERGMGFEDIIALIEAGKLLRVLEHENRDKYPNQWIYEVDVGGYVYVVPVVRDGDTLFLKTIFPSRKATKRHRKGERNEEKD